MSSITYSMCASVRGPIHVCFILGISTSSSRAPQSGGRRGVCRTLSCEGISVWSLTRVRGKPPSRHPDDHSPETTLDLLRTNLSREQLLWCKALPHPCSCPLSRCR